MSVSEVETLAKEYAEGYKAYQIKTGKTFDIPAATAFAVLDLMNMYRSAVRSSGEASALELIRDEVAYSQEQWTK